MITGRIGTDLEANWARDDAEVAHRSAWPAYKGTGASDSLTYFEIDVGRRLAQVVTASKIQTAAAMPAATAANWKNSQKSASRLLIRPPR